MPLARAKPWRRRHAALGHRHHQRRPRRRHRVGRRWAPARRAARPCAPGPRPRCGRRAARRGGRSRRTRSRHSVGSMRSGGNGWSERGPSTSMTTISPGSSSRTRWAPTMSRAGVSDASTQPAVEPAEAQRPEAVRVADRRRSGRRREHRARTRPRARGSTVDERAGAGRRPWPSIVPGQQLGHEVAVAADRAGQHARPRRPAPRCWSGCRCGRGRTRGRRRRRGRRAGRCARCSSRSCE